MKDPNNLIDKHFEEQRINDLKVDINTVLAEVKKSYGKCNGDALGVKGLPDCAGCRAYRLYQDLTWFKTLL